MMDNNYCIYMHINILNNKKYIGATCNIEKRFGKNGYGYLHKTKDGKYNQPHFARAILKYGWDNFRHEILEENLTKEQANILEEEYIQKFETYKLEKGYNIRTGGYNGELSEETKNKLRKEMQGKYDGNKNPFYNRRHSEKTKKIIGEKNKEYSKNRDFTGKNNFGFIKYIYTCIETGEQFKSPNEANKKLGINRSSIARACNYPHKTAGGYHWKKERIE